ncbi:MULTISPECIES: acyl CoA:acetate/3-ketoacid CoA transferase [unclassified Aurantimonas]|uniref:acyl CoA:acetate/3-ketoacid CoA transferase n=1 Tax=unclassified Aurantimonas TaxID=2638230 RepID=UPI002E16FDD9|nr:MULTISPECIES: CoA-transferase [unclassified Aurantimonas]MEC5293112.1 CoA-transferase [Aurantimonas sp. C2-3-R2]MEC5414181.1 CoA-transferase [Aurantimonas sp. C2-4-R8]
MISLITAADAAELVKEKDVLAVGGNGGTGAPDAILRALEQRFLTTETPRSLTLFHVTGIGAGSDCGLCHLAHAGLIDSVFGGNFGLQIPFMKLIRDEEIKGYNFPQGVMAQMCRALAAKQPGVITHVGLHTYMDPRQEGGRMNTCTREEMVELINLVGREWLFYRAPTPTIAFLRGTSADEDGYVSMEHEATTREDLSIAQAVHNAGGIVICQVKRLVKRGTLNPHMVKIPGFLINHFVLVPDQMQTYATHYDPSRSGETRVPVSTLVPDPMTDRRVIARRAACQLRPADVVNLGVGISAMIPNVAAEEDIDEIMTLTVESGVIGGVPGYGREFGTAYNPRAIIDQPYQFDFYDGGGLTCAFLSFAEVDGEGNVNVTRFGERYDGSGGFINITQSAQRLVFSGSLTGGGLDVVVEDGKIFIRREGKFKKFVPAVGQISFNGTLARERRQDITFISERAVFKLEADGLVLVEIAPGVRLQEDVLDQIGFSPRVSSDLKLMDPRIFRPGRMGLRKELLDHNTN